MAKYKVNDIIKLHPDPEDYPLTRYITVVARILEIDEDLGNYHYVFIQHDDKKYLGMTIHFPIYKIDQNSDLAGHFYHYHYIWASINA